ncbi:AraC family transcriptional regulator [Desulfosporosinus acidiphilus]|uniref:AraC family transcriptional regulator n=1 Tax=Desulfosporosinus acidiphilus TaxID=885581 RepID=UPI001FA6B975|nr:AraC family transcriptional regulator [Desulfosporosinus acidiphilus]
MDIALKYGYDSSDAFTRAFKKLHSVTPNAVRENSVQLKAFPRIFFQITIKGDVEKWSIVLRKLILWCGLLENGKV